jgi:hypothetical protein
LRKTSRIDRPSKTPDVHQDGSIAGWPDDATGFSLPDGTEPPT